MTVREIAEAVGQTDRSVRNWVKRLAEKDSVIAEKLSVSSPMKPADYTLAEIRYEREKTDRQKNMTLFDDDGGAS